MYAGIFTSATFNTVGLLFSPPVVSLLVGRVTEKLWVDFHEVWGII